MEASSHDFMTTNREKKASSQVPVIGSPKNILQNPIPHSRQERAAPSGARNPLTSASKDSQPVAFPLTGNPFGGPAPSKLRFLQQKTRKGQLNNEPFRRAMGGLYPLQKSAFTRKVAGRDESWVRPFTDLSRAFPYTGCSMQQVSDMIREQQVYADTLDDDLRSGPQSPTHADERTTKARLEAAQSEIRCGMALLELAQEQIKTPDYEGPFKEEHTALLASKAYYYGDTQANPLRATSLADMLQSVRLRITMPIPVAPSASASAASQIDYGTDDDISSIWSPLGAAAYGAEDDDEDDIFTWPKVTPEDELYENNARLSAGQDVIDCVQKKQPVRRLFQEWINDATLVDNLWANALTTSGTKLPRSSHRTAMKT